MKYVLIALLIWFMWICISTYREEKERLRELKRKWRKLDDEHHLTGSSLNR